MALDQDPYWEFRDVPRLPADVVNLSKAQRKAWRARYLQDLYIPDGLDAQQESIWRSQNTVQVLTGNQTKPTSNPLRKVPSRLQSNGNAQGTSSSQANSPEANEEQEASIPDTSPPKLSRRQRKLIPQASPPQTSNPPKPSISQAIPPKPSKAQKSSIAQAKPLKTSDARKISHSRPLPPQALGYTRLCIPPKKQWHNADGSVWQPSQPLSAAKPDSNKIRLSNQQLRDSFPQPLPKRQKTSHVVFPSATERRLSSIPTNLGSSNGVEAFKRMASIVDQSDSEPSDSSSDDEEVAKPVVRGSVAESFADRINEGSPRTEKASPNSQLQSTLEEAIVAEEAHSSNQHSSPSLKPKTFGNIFENADQSGLVNTSVAQQSTDDDNNMQDVISLSSDAEPGDDAEIVPLSEPAVEEKQGAPKFNINAEESTQEVYEAVDEILEDVCSSTRALPSSTSTSSQLRKDPLITHSSSRHSELVLEPMTEQQDVAPTHIVNDYSDSDDSMAEVGEEIGELDMDGVSTGSTSDAGSNIVVAMRDTSMNHADGDDDDAAEMNNVQPTRRVSLKSKSSSSILEELSQSPTPPPPAIGSQASVTTRRTSQRHRGSQQVEVSEALPASPRVIVTRVSDPKRKVTGVTSKHFSMSKPSETPRQSKRVAAKSASQASSQGPAQTIPQSNLPWIIADDDSGDDEIQVASRRQSPRVEAPAKVVEEKVMKEDSQKSPSNSAPLLPSTATPLKRRIAYVDLTGDTITDSSTKPIAYVDLTGPTSEAHYPVPSGSPPNANDEPLDHLAKLLRSPHFSKEEKSAPAEVAKAKTTRSAATKELEATGPTTPNTPKRTLKTPKKTTGTKSPHFITDRVDLYNTTTSSRRVPAGTSTVPVPPLSSPAFGIIQEKLWKEPFWLLIAVTFLNKTTGRAAVPIFWKVKKLFPTPEELAEADPEVLLEMVKTLGLQNSRSKRLVSMARAWVGEPPVKGRGYRTLNYPEQGDGRASQVPGVVEEDVEVCKGSLEIGQIPGCGAYAYDSWRVFCRDVLRGVAEDYDGKGAAAAAGFEPEWKRVLPGDKELRACLRWMWMREGWVWDPITGSKRVASSAEMEMARDGQMLIEDEGERKFAERAVEGVEGPSPVRGEEAGDDTL